MHRKRPTIETAHDYHRQGSFSVSAGHLLMDAERAAELETIQEDLRTLIKRQFPRTNILEYAVLKTHLLVEHALSQYIRFLAIPAVELDTLKKFSFPHKIEIAYLMGLGVFDPILLPTLERLNQLRNQTAHKFQMDRSQLDEMLRINSDDYDGFAVKDDKERIRRLKHLCAFLCAQISGGMLGVYAVLKKGI